ncbi:acriflavine sensitivity control acr-2 [Fusarium albosuccineum]|uniref:Acriflavine sensitivity control acr-2 n=1 Tax=Fusarium albosuccineum TaxID=1237068 RepID=A0A8H4LKS5_9HYPO|nr:acriflavine sensitivity control acr-2 [Fusarium albosuccineum]
MPPKKRAYVPKTKGCHECSKRRIHCDRTEPSCNKCISRGLNCSGLGIRHRFNKGVAARGKWAGKTIESVYEENEWSLPNGKDATVPSKPTSTVNPEDTETHHDTSTATSDDDDIEVIPMSPEARHLIPGGFSLLDDHTIFCSLYLQEIPENTPAWKRNLLLHFSQYISTEMIAIDGVHNDWRHLLLPLAQTDELVMDAVLTVSAFHFQLNKLTNSMRKGDRQYGIFGNKTCYEFYVPDPYQLCGRTLQGLRQRQELLSVDQTMKHSVLVSLLLLITAVLVTGGSDFPVLLRMLESALDAIGGKDGLGTGILAEFIMRELHKLRVYAAPHLGEKTGIEMISSQARTAQLFGCLNHCIQQYPEHASVFSQVADLVYQARDIYLQQVTSDQTSAFFNFEPAPTNPGSVARVQRFIDTLERIPHTSPVEHMLIWTTFVAASDAQLDEHKAFFERVLRRHHARSGFGNLLKGIESLQKIWGRKPGERWTSLLPQVGVLVA